MFTAEEIRTAIQTGNLRNLEDQLASSKKSGEANPKNND